MKDVTHAHPIVLLHPSTSVPWPGEWTLHFSDDAAMESFLHERGDDLRIRNHRPFYLLQEPK